MAATGRGDRYGGEGSGLDGVQLLEGFESVVQELVEPIDGDAEVGRESGEVDRASLRRIDRRVATTSTRRPRRRPLPR